MGREPIPWPVLAFGLLGLIPFLAPLAIAFARPEWRVIAGLLQAGYGAIILSFLGGVRWAFAVVRPNPSTAVIAGTMAPSVAAFAILAVFIHAPNLALLALAVALFAQWLWDIRLADAPGWFARLRTILSAGAILGLVAGALLIG